MTGAKAGEKEEDAGEVEGRRRRFPVFFLRRSPMWILTTVLCFATCLFFWTICFLTLSFLDLGIAGGVYNLCTIYSHHGEVSILFCSTC